MSVIHVNIDQLAATVAADMEKLGPAVLEAVQVTVQMHGPRLFAGHVATAQPRPPVDRGTYRRSTHVEDLQNGVVMFNRAPYAGVLEEGRRPGRAPPVRALEGWILRKGITNDRKEAKAMAFAIARKMAKQGWPFAPNEPMRLMAKTGKSLEPLVHQAIEAAMREIVGG